MARRTHIGLALLIIAVSVSCGRFLELPTAPPDPDPIDPSATLTAVQQSVFTPTCAVAGCHDVFGASSSAELELTAGRAYENLVGRPSTQIPTLLRVASGDPAQSYLMRKITGTQPLSGERMPFSGQPLSDQQIQLIRDWIRRGAPND